MQAGPLQIQAALHKNCWIIATQWFKAKPKSIFPFKGSLINQDMSSLQGVPTFYVTGFDNAGPFSLKHYSFSKIQPWLISTLYLLCFKRIGSSVFIQIVGQTSLVQHLLKEYCKISWRS